MTDRKDHDMSEEPEDALVVLRAELDQALALAPELARVARGYYNTFKAEGFSDSEASYFTAVQLIERPLSPPR